MGAKKHHNLRAWRSAMDLAREIYRYTKGLPDEERYGLVSQLRRAAVSVPSNIAEGVGRSTERDKLRILVVARGSLAEIETQICLCSELGMGGLKPEAADTLERTFAQLCKLITNLELQARR